MGYQLNNEPLYVVEIVGMVLCFCAVVAITLEDRGEDKEVL